jgi:hypothetical protein
MLTEPVVPVGSSTLLTNSAKYAHYAPGLVNRKVRFNTLAACVEAAATGEAAPPPAWLAQTARSHQQQQRRRGFSTGANTHAFSTSTAVRWDRMGRAASVSAPPRAATTGGGNFGRGAMQRYSAAVQLAPMRSLLRLGLRAMR